MPLGWIAGATLAVGIGADVVQGMNASNQQGIANSQLGIAQQQLQMQQTAFGEQQGFEGQLESLIKDPSSVSKLPGYQFQMDQGTQAVAKQMAATGYGGSGNEAIALQKFGQGTASSFYGQQASLLAQLAGLAPSSASSFGANANSGAAGASASSASAAGQWNNTFQNLGAITGLMGGNYGANTGIPDLTAAGGAVAPASGAGISGGQLWPVA